MSYNEAADGYRQQHAQAFLKSMMDPSQPSLWLMSSGQDAASTKYVDIPSVWFAIVNTMLLALFQIFSSIFISSFLAINIVS